MPGPPDPVGAGRRFRHLPDCFGCGRDNPTGIGAVVTAGPLGATARTTFGTRHQGAPGLVHGSLLVTLLDEAMGSLPDDEVAVRVTAELSVRFRRPVSIGREVEAVASVTGRDGRRLTITAVVRYVGDDVVRAEASALYVLVRDAGALAGAAGAGTGGDPPAGGDGPVDGPLP